jgi:hypothetical protein
MKFIIVFLFIMGCREKPTCKIVGTIGGCDDKYCGVRFRDSSFGNALYPVRGRRMCLQKGIYYPEDI